MGYSDGVVSGPTPAMYQPNGPLHDIVQKTPALVGWTRRLVFVLCSRSLRALVCTFPHTVHTYTHKIQTVFTKYVFMCAHTHVCSFSNSSNLRFRF